MNGNFELYTNKEWMILPSFVHGILPTLMYNSNNHIALRIEEKKRPYLAVAGGHDFIRDSQVTEDGEVVPRTDGWGADLLIQMKQPFVNVMPIDGAITRNGDACTYGSKDIRDWMMQAADNQYCRAHVIVINTPGGSAWAKNDFQQAIEYAHARGQRVYALIDGLCASAGMYLAALCDEVYVVNLKDQLGCIGVMASFFTMKNGDKNQFTDETYREYYATKSINKNKEIRDIANDDDATLLIEELDKLEAEFRNDVFAAFPKATDEQVDGKLYYAEEVMDVFCDGQMLLGDVVARAFAVADGNEKPVERTANRKIAKLADNRTAQKQAVRKAITMLNPNNNTINMKEKFPALFAALQVEEMQMSEDGAFLNMGLLETLNAAVEASKKEAAEAKAIADQLTAEKAGLESQLTEKASEIETLKADHEKAMNDMEGSHTTALAEKDATIAQMQEAIDNYKQSEAVNAENMQKLQANFDGAQAAVTTAEQTIAERDQTIADLNARITELENDPGEEPEATAQPAGNGTAAQAPQIVTNTRTTERGKTYEEMRADWGDYDK